MASSKDIAKPSQLDRIELKLDALLDALADEAHDEEEQEQGYDLDGLLLDGERTGLDSL